MARTVGDIKAAHARVVSDRRERPYTFANCPNKGQNTERCRFCGHAHRPSRRMTERKPVDCDCRGITGAKQIGDMISDGFRMLEMMG